MDTYGHLLEGAHAADLTAVPTVLEATGTNPKLALHVLRSRVPGGCLAGANLRKTEANLAGDECEPIQRKNRKIPGKNAVFCAGAKAEGKGFEPSTGFPAPDFESGP